MEPNINIVTISSHTAIKQWESALKVGVGSMEYKDFGTSCLWYPTGTYSVWRIVEGASTSYRFTVLQLLNDTDMPIFSHGKSPVQKSDANIP